jgi:hypothetical protein
MAETMSLNERPAGVIFGIFLGVAAGAERLVAGAGKDHRIDIAGVRGGAEGEDRAFHHVGRVGVELARVVERDPDIVEAGRRRSVGPPGRAFLVDNAVRHLLARGIGHEIVVVE